VLIRDDFSILLLPIFNEANIASLESFERPAFADMVNEIVITYRKRGDLEDKTITAQDLASVQAQQGIVSQTSSFPGIDSDDIAAKVAVRELKQLSTPLARVRFIANREAWDISPGDVIRLSWAAYGISGVVIRVTAMDYGTYDNGLVGIDGIEDVFGLPLNSYITPTDTGWNDEVVAPVAATNARTLELPFFVIQTALPVDVTNILEDDDAFLQAVTEAPAPGVFNVRLNTRIGVNDFAEVASGALTPTAQLVAALNETTKTTISIKNASSGSSAVVVGSYAYINNEVVRVDAIDTVLNTVDLGRGFMDTIPTTHAADSIIYFADGNSAIDPTVYTNADSVDAKLLTQTSMGILELDDATTINLVMTGRQFKPYNGAQIKIGGAYFPTALINDISILVTWAHQDRTQQLVVGGSDWYETSLGAPEAGVTYTVRYYNNGTATLLFTDSGLTGLSSSFTPDIAISSTITVRVEVEAVRGGQISEFVFSHIFDYTKPLAVRVLENGNTRTLENANRRILE
jgi:hypothetical protein